MKNSISEKKNSLAMLYSRLETTDQRISIIKRDGRLIEMIQFEVTRTKTLKEISNTSVT